MSPTKTNTLLVVFVVGIFSFLMLLSLNDYPPTLDDKQNLRKADPIEKTEIAAVPILSDQKIQALPKKILIPAIGVDSSIEKVGLASDGTVDVPKGPDNAGWFDSSAIPGMKGDSVIVGHYGWKDGIPAVFDRLSLLKKGMAIYVIRDDGRATEFIVREVKTYSEDDDASIAFSSNDEGAHLNLITCGGVWDRSKKSYSNRMVVFSDKK